MIRAMFLRSRTRRKDGNEHRYWSIVENRRVRGNRVVQRQVLYLGEINDCRLACRLWDQLELDDFWSPRLPDSRKGTRWLNVLKALVIYRLDDRVMVRPPFRSTDPGPARIVAVPAGLSDRPRGERDILRPSAVAAAG